MRKPPKLALAASALAVLAPAILPSPAAARQFGSGVVVCTNCASEVTAAMQQAQQVLQVAKMAEQYITQLQQYATQIQQYQNMLQNTKLLSGNEFGNLVQDIQRVRGVINQGKTLAYTASNLDDQFKDRFKSLKDYRNLLSPDDMTARYQQWSDETNDTALTTLKALGAESENLDDEAELMAKLQERASTADGQMEAIQVGNELSVAAVGQMQKLRSLQMLQIQMMAKDIAARGDKEAAEYAQKLETYTVYDPTFDGKTY